MGPCVISDQFPRILLVEDDDAVRRSLQLLLGAQGYDVRAYPTAVGLFQDAEALRSVCLVADLVMPETDAIGLLAELKKAGWKGAAILISGYLDEARKNKAHEVGYDIVLEKPISDFTLVRSVRQLLENSADCQCGAC